VASGAEQRRVLIVDDDPAVRMLVREAIEATVTVVEAESGRAALQAFFQERPDLVVLDVGLPDLDGREVLQRIRELANTPVIMLTALDQDPDMIRALQGGADEYVTKPFSPLVLAARIEAVLRRALLPPPTESNRLELDRGHLAIDVAAGRVWVRGQEADLTPTEFRLLVLLCRHADRVLSPSQILRQIWGPGYEAEGDYVKTYIRRLRRKIEVDPARPRYIVARRGMGYGLVRQPASLEEPEG